MKLLNTNQLNKMTEYEKGNYKIDMLFAIEDVILTQVFGDDYYLHEDDLITEADVC